MANQQQVALVERVTSALTPTLIAVNMDLEAVEIKGTGKARLLRVAIDQDGGVSLDDVAEVTQLVSQRLDEADIMGRDPYTLEVTSRGIDRPLTMPRHWRRNLTRLVEVQLSNGMSITGRAIASDDDTTGGVTLQIAGQIDGQVNGAHQYIAYEDIARALVQIEFNRTEKT
jgi:ribosome maturation factor RimP